MEYIVIKCMNCELLTFIRSNQKTVTCKKCGIRNNFKKIKKFSKAKFASDYIKKRKLKGSDFDGNFHTIV